MRIYSIDGEAEPRLTSGGEAVTIERKVTFGSKRLEEL